MGASKLENEASIELNDVAAEMEEMIEEAGEETADGWAEADETMANEERAGAMELQKLASAMAKLQVTINNRLAACKEGLNAILSNTFKFKTYYSCQFF